MTVPGPSTFGKRFRRIRKGYRLTLAELAPNGEVTFSELERIESGEHKPCEAKRERLWSLLDAAIARLSNDRIDADELALMRDVFPWADDDVARACLRPGGMSEEEVAECLRLSTRRVRGALSDALAKLRAAARGEGGEAELVREWLAAVLAVREERDQRLALQEPDAESWDPESETSGQAVYPRTRETQTGIPNEVAVKKVRYCRPVAGRNLNAHVREEAG